jgi:adenylate kinase family enzyme
VRAQIIIFSGPPGAGKSTVAPLLADHFDRSAVPPMDDFFHFIRRGRIAPFLPDAAQQNQVVTEVLAAAAARYAAQGYTVILDGIVGPWFLAIYLQAPRSDDLGVHYIVLRPSSDVASARAVSRRPDQLTDPEPVAGLYAALSELGSYEAHVVDSSLWDPLETTNRVLEAVAADDFRLPAP